MLTIIQKEILTKIIKNIKFCMCVIILHWMSIRYNAFDQILFGFPNAHKMQYK